MISASEKNCKNLCGPSIFGQLSWVHIIPVEAFTFPDLFVGSETLDLGGWVEGSLLISVIFKALIRGQDQQAEFHPDDIVCSQVVRVQGRKTMGTCRRKRD